MSTVPPPLPVPDYFALLDLPRGPWLDAAEVQARFLARSAEVHPDRVHNAPEAERAEANQRFAALNAACKCLRDPKQRLRHLLELERQAALTNLERIPTAGSDFYFKLGQTTRDVDLFLADRAKAVSRLARVSLFEAAFSWRERLQTLQSGLAERQQQLEAEIKDLNRLWERAAEVRSASRLDALPLERLESIYREYSFLARWREQLSERLLQLTVD